MKVLVTGANGFTGGTVVRALIADGHQVVAAVRAGRQVPPGAEVRVVGDLGPDTDWTQALPGVDAVVHLAARVHQMTETAADPLALYRRVNCDATVRLAAQAAQRGAKRFIFVSSITVNGEQSGLETPYCADDKPAPKTPYAQSKWEAEQALWALAPLNRLQLTVLRPPLILGAGAKGNLETLTGLIERGVPLPIGSITNRRSLLGVDNLAAAIAFCLKTPTSIGGTYLLKDDKDVSVPELVRLLGQAMGKSPLILPCPVAVLKLLGILTGKSAVIRRLTGSLWVDDQPLRALGWTPPLTLEQGLGIKSL